MTAAEKAEKKRRRQEYKTIFINGKTHATRHFSQAGLTLFLTVEVTESRVEFSGTVHNHTDKPVHIEQLWLAESIVELGGPWDSYRVYYNSGNQESSGTCRLSAIGQAVEKTQSNLDPDDPDATGGANMFASTCIQPDCVRSQYMTTVYLRWKGRR